MPEYKIAKGWGIFIYVAGVVFVALGVGGIVVTITDKEGPSGVVWILIPASFGFIALGLFVFLETYKSKVIIDPEKIFSQGFFSTRQLLLADIKGFRVNENYIVIAPISIDKSTLKISKYFGKSNEIITWLASGYPDLDVLTTVEETTEILTNEEYGRTTEEREAKLKSARRTALVLNIAGGIAGVWTLFWARPYEYAILTSVLVPILAIIAVKFSGGLIRMDEKNSTAYPTVVWAILGPAIALPARATLDFNLFEYIKI